MIRLLSTHLREIELLGQKIEFNVITKQLLIQYFNYTLLLKYLPWRLSSKLLCYLCVRFYMQWYKNLWNLGNLLSFRGYNI